MSEEVASQHRHNRVSGRRDVERLGQLDDGVGAAVLTDFRHMDGDGVGVGATSHANHHY